MKKWMKYLSILLMTVIILPGLIYLGLAIYYQDSFMYGTWINNIYCTGKTIEEVEKELSDNFNYQGLYVISPQDVEMLEASFLELKYDFKSSLEEYRRNQNPLVWWGRMLTGHQSEEVLPKVSFQEEVLEQWIYNMKSYQSNLTMEQDSIKLVIGDEGYEIQEKKEKILNVELAKEKLKEAIINLQPEINLEEQRCYFTREETLEMEEMRNLFEKVKQIQNYKITYQINDQTKVVTPLEISSWIATKEDGAIKVDANGEVSFSKDGIISFVDRLASDYDTWGNFPFVTHDGKEVVIKKCNYGTQINRKKEVDFLMEYLKNPTEVVREPVYIKNVVYQNRNFIEHTYVEVDMTRQKMFFFSEGEKVFETDVVTGRTSANWGTPELVGHVYYKTKNTYLTGRDYRSFVYFWAPVYGGIGLHDATWRTEFGGDLYIKGGSHGCINTPLEKMTELYDMLEVGMPVVIHY